MGLFWPWAAVERPWPTKPMVLMFVKVAKLRFAKKNEKKRIDVELRREFAYNSNGIGLHTGLYVLWLRYGEKS